MDEDFGSTFITIEDDSGNEFELELLGDMEYNGSTYVAFLPGNEMNEEDPDYGIIILRSVTGKDGTEEYETIDNDDELDDVYEKFMAILFEDEDEESIRQ